MSKRSLASALLANSMYWNSYTRIFSTLPEDIQLYILSFFGSTRPVKPKIEYTDFVNYELDDEEQEVEADNDSDYDPKDDNGCESDDD